MDSDASKQAYVTPLGPCGRPAGLGRGVALLSARSRAAREVLRAYDAGAEAAVTFEVLDTDGAVRRCTVHGAPLHHLLEESLADDVDRWPEADALHHARGRAGRP